MEGVSVALGTIVQDMGGNTARYAFGKFLTQIQDFRLSSYQDHGEAMLGDPLFTKLVGLVRSKIPQRSGAKGNGRFAVATSIGSRSQNQDRCVLLKGRFGGSGHEDFNLAVVCDGLGGMEDGEAAASIGAAVFASAVIEGARSPIWKRLEHAIGLANQTIFESYRGRGGTTLTAAYVSRHDGAYFCHVGDSRLFTIGPDRSLKQVTRDDTFASVLKRPEEDFRRDNRVLQFVGIGDEMEPQIGSAAAGGTSSFLLTSDGAHDLPPSVLERVVAAATGPLDLARKLTQLSDILGGLDNSSAAVLPCRFDDELSNSPGLEITLLTPADELTILFPAFFDQRFEARREQQPPPKSKKQDAEKPTERAASAKPKSKRQSRKSRTKKAANEELPLGDGKAADVNVEFHDKPKTA